METLNVDANVDSIAELVSYLRKTTVNMTTSESFNLLNRILGDSIAIRYEILNNSTTVKDEAPVKMSGDDGKRSKYDYLDDKTVHRVLLTSRRLKADFSRRLVRELNGVILEYPSWKVLAVPAPMFNPKFREVDVINNLDHYSIYEIKDGTTVTIYWNSYTTTDGNKIEEWCVSSTNGFDVSKYQWMGVKTYMEAITECATEYPEFALDKLDKNISYTIGFRHLEFHPLKADPAKLWLVQTCNLNEINADVPVLSVSCDTDIGLPLQVAIVKSGEPHDLMKWMKAVNDAATHTYMTSLREDFIKAPHYGYFLRANSSLPAKYRIISDIILESHLLKTVRGMVYNLPKRRLEKDAPITATTRQEYTILRAYLGNSKYDFITLFPQFEPVYHKYDKIFKEITDAIITQLKKQSTKTVEKKLDVLINKFVEHILSEKVNVLTAEGPGIVQDFLKDSRQLELYYAFIISE